MALAAELARRLIPGATYILVPPRRAASVRYVVLTQQEIDELAARLESSLRADRVAREGFALFRSSE